LQLHVHAFPRFAVFCLGGFIAIALSTAVMSARHYTKHAQYRSDYGHALSSLAARQALDATFNRDLVKLQVILQNVASNPRVILATIHDVENNLLVQAGDGRQTNTLTHTYSAPITLHDSIAGYVSITIINDAAIVNPATVLLTMLSALLLALGLWSLYHNRIISIQFGSKHNSNSESNPESSSEVAPSNDALTNDFPSSTDTATNSDGINNNLSTDSDGGEGRSEDMIYAVIHIKNYDVLQQQLSGQNFRKTFSRMEKIIADVLALYGGSKFVLEENYFILNFPAHDSRAEAIFRGVCSAYLVLDLTGTINNVPLDLAGLVSAKNDSSHRVRLPISGLILSVDAEDEELLQRRVQFMPLDEDNDSKVVSCFEQPFQSLIEKQQKQLLQLL